MSHSTRSATGALLAIISVSAAAAATPASPAMHEVSHSEVEPAAEMHVLAKFIKVMLKYSAAAPTAAGGEAEFRVCLTSEADEAYSLRDLQDLAIQNWRIDVAVVASPSALSAACHLAFISRDEVDGFDYGRLTREGVLTMSDSYDFARKGGVVEIEFQEDRVAFFIGFHKIRKTALSPSSKFLRLATDVYR